MKYICLQSDPYTFHIQIQIQAFEDTILVSVGGEDIMTPCMQIILEEGIAHINDVIFRNTCTSSGNLVQGEGGMKHMIRVVLRWLIEAHPEIKKVTLIDRSAYMNVPLGEMKLLTEGQTWYQKHFGAKPASDHGKQTLKRYRDVFHKYAADFTGIPIATWKDREKVTSLLKKYHLSYATGLEYRIPLRTIQTYTEAYKVQKCKTKGGGLLPFPVRDQLAYFAHEIG